MAKTTGEMLKSMVGQVAGEEGAAEGRRCTNKRKGGTDALT